MRNDRLFQIAMVGFALLISGCVATNDPMLSKYIKPVDKAISDAKKSGSDKSHPKRFQEIVKLRQDAEKIYAACMYYEAVDLLKQAKVKSDELKVASATPPVVAAPAPKPKPALVRAPAAPKDSDLDGVMDPDDKCPGTPKGAKVDERGCWTVSDVLFDFDKSTIKPQFHKELDEVVDVLKKNPNVKIEIQGHTDSIGTESYNQALSEKRGSSVERYFVKKGLKADHFSVKGFGKTKPVKSNATKAGRAKNRRVEFKPNP